MKFIQLLFYYVQDVSLFKVHIPVQDSQRKSTFAYFLQFSPRIMSTFSSMTDICTAWINTPVLKILFHSLVAMCALLYRSTIYLGQWFLSRFTYGYSNVFSGMRVRLCQTFIVIFLLSYQKLEKGVFTLVKCVPINSQAVLHVQGGIECYTKWQVGLTIFLCTCVAPVCVVLALCPYFLKVKKMSLKFFFFACLCPIPALVCYMIKQLHARKCNSLKLKSHTEIIKTPGSFKHEQCTEAILDIVFEPYRRLLLGGISINWLGIH